MLDVDSMKLAQTLCSLTPGPGPLLTIGFSGRRLALFVAGGGDEEGGEHLLVIYKPTVPSPRVHLANVQIYVEYPLAAKVSDIHRVYDDDTPPEE